MRTLGLIVFLTTLAHAFFPAAHGQGNVCEGVRLTLENKDVHFSRNCGKNPKWRYVVESPNSSYLEFEIGKAFTAKRKGKEFPGQEFVGCIVVITPRYPRGCTFSPNYIGFQGRAVISANHVGTVGLGLSDPNNDANRLKVWEDLRTHSGNFDIGIDLEGKGNSFWAPCTGKATFAIGLEAHIDEVNEEKPGRELSLITVHSGTQVYRNTTKLGFKECDPPE